MPATWNTISLANNKLTGDIPTYMASAELDYPTNILLSVSRPRHVAGRAPSLSMFTWLCTSHRSLYLFASACQRWYIAKNTIRNSEALALDQARLHPPHDPTTQGNSFSNGCDTAFSNLASVCTSSSRRFLTCREFPEGVSARHCRVCRGDGAPPQTSVKPAPGPPGILL